jgi:Tat protein secretion system quality control protein TatD with DNase activity
MARASLRPPASCILKMRFHLSPQFSLEAGLLLSFDMKQDITSKLNIELDQEITSERQVVYILVEARKLLEQQETLHDFRAFKLCSDWAVHPKLTRKNSQTILKHFDAYEAEHQKSGVSVAEFGLETLHDFMTYKRFRAEFIEALCGG